MSDDTTKDSKVSEKSWISVGLAVILFGTISGGIWWAATVSSKLDSLISLYRALNLADTEMSVKYISLKERVDRIELIGSPQLTKMQERLDTLCNEINKLKGSKP